MSCRSIALSANDLIPSSHLASEYLEKTHTQLKKYEAWISEFPATLAAAKKDSRDLGTELVWQDELVEFWQPFTVIQLELFRLYEQTRIVNSPLAEMVEPYIDPPSHAQIEYATDEAQFLEREGQSRKQIAYQVRRLTAWHQNFAHWVRHALDEIQLARREI